MKLEEAREKEEPVRLAEIAPAFEVELHAVKLLYEPLKEEEERLRVNGAYTTDTQSVNEFFSNTAVTDVRLM